MPLFLSRRLSVLRSNKMDLEGFIERMNEATRRAEASLQGLKQAANGAKAELDRPLSQAQTLRDELSFLIQRADAMGEKLRIRRAVVLAVRVLSRKPLPSQSGAQMLPVWKRADNRKTPPQTTSRAPRRSSI